MDINQNYKGVNHRENLSIVRHGRNFRLPREKILCVAPYLPFTQVPNTSKHIFRLATQDFDPNPPNFNSKPFKVRPDQLD